MGVGKTTVGKKLAAYLGVSFIDLDKYIEAKYHKSIPEIFEEKGEKGFRHIESQSLKEVSEIENVVISTGGGAPCFFDNMDIMNKSGVSVYISAKPEELASRLIASKNVRPIIAGMSKDELIPFITEHMGEREYYYNQSKIIYKSDFLLTKEEIYLTVEGIARELKKYQNDF